MINFFSSLLVWLGWSSRAPDVAVPRHGWLLPAPSAMRAALALAEDARPGASGGRRRRRH